jgi:lysozyme family protein
MPITLSDALIFTLKWEGTKFTDHPLDPGGATKYGIIQSRYDQYRDSKKLSRRSVNDITTTEYTEIYDVYYWTPVRAEYLDGTLGLVLFDTAVNMGTAGCIRRLQASLKVPITGIWSQAISDVIHSSDQTEVALNICKLRIAKRYARVKQRADQKVFLKGWLNRDNDLIKKVKSMVGLLSVLEDEYDIETIYDSFDENLIKELDLLDEQDENEGEL